MHWEGVHRILIMGMVSKAEVFDIGRYDGAISILSPILDVPPRDRVSAPRERAHDAGSNPEAEPQYPLGTQGMQTRKREYMPI
ncbi:hypothetical protein FOPE_06039 [Fonsecaea pedrosoi]|nr:hypothetical protein FOPE_06039 [Fonsecaea pedrosoi]